MDKNSEFCTCKNSSSVYTETGEWGCWDMCSDCNKVIGDSYTEYNHYDGEDHCLYHEDLI